MKRKSYLRHADAPPYHLKSGFSSKFSFKEWSARRAAAGKPLTAVQTAPQFVKRYDNPLPQLPTSDAVGA